MADNSATTVNAPPAWLRPIHARPRLLIGAAIGLAVALLAPHDLRQHTRWIFGWDVGVIVYIALVFSAWNKAETTHIRSRAARQDEGRHFILVLALCGVLASVAAIVGELNQAKDHHGVREALMTLFGMGTVALSWLFLQTFLAQHYAHEYYGNARSDNGADHEGLNFPGDEDPGYWDFFHFAITIGATAQTADIAITSKPMRAIVTWHALMSYTFNTVVLALAISLLAGML